MRKLSKRVNTIAFESQFSSYFPLIKQNPGTDTVFSFSIVVRTHFERAFQTFPQRFTFAKTYLNSLSSQLELRCTQASRTFDMPIRVN